MKQINVAIIGQGRSGRNIHGLYFMKDRERFKIAAVSDLLEERRQRAEREYGCEAYADYRCLFGRKDVDLVVNATYSHLHVPITKELLENGFNVLCEKPAARKAADFDSLVEASKMNGKVFAVFQEVRYAPYFLQIQKVIGSGVLGRIVQIDLSENYFSRRYDWQTMRERDGGNLLNKGPHQIDHALRLFGPGVMPEITCILDDTVSFGDADDYVKLIFKGKGRPTIDIEMSSCSAYPHALVNIQGTLGGLTGDITHVEWKYFKPEEAPKQKLVREPIVDCDGLPAYCSEELNWYTESWDFPANGNAFDAATANYYDMLYKVLTEGADLGVTLPEVRMQIAVMEECLKRNPLQALNA